MNNSEISYKLKYILHELGMNKKEFLEACRMFSPSISKPTILNAINGKNTIAPTIETLSTIIKVCQTSGNEKLKYISYDFLLNDNIKEVEAKNATIYQSIGLSDEVIDRLKQFNHPLYFDYGSIINYFLIHNSAKYWEYLEFYKRTVEICNVLDKEKREIKKVLKLFDEDKYLTYVMLNFRNIYDIYLGLKNDKYDIEKFKDLMLILKNHFKFLVLELEQKFLENVEVS